MILVVAGVGLALLALPGLARRLGRALVPASWARLVAAGLLSGAALFELALLLAAAPPLLRASGLVRLARTCEEMLGGLDPGGAWLGLVAAVIAVFLPVAFWRAVSGARAVNRRMRVGAGFGVHRPLDCGAELVIVPSEAHLVVSVPGEPGQIMLSEGLLSSLGTSQLELVCRHEAAHLCLGHARHLELAVAVERAFRFWPFAARSTRSLRVALERWADEEAAGAAAESRAALRGALLSVACTELSGAVAAFGSAGVLERIDALTRQPAPIPASSFRLLLLPGIALGVIAAYGVAAWGHDAYCVIGMATRCFGS